MKRRVLKRWIPLLVVLMFSSVSMAQQNEQVIAVGGQKTIRVDFPIGRSAIGSESICDFRILGDRREVLLLGRRSGETTLSLWDQKDKLREEIVIRVVPSSGDAKQIMDELEQLLGNIEGIHYRDVGGVVWIEGEVLTMRDKERIDRVLESYPEVQSLVEMSPITQEMIDQAEAGSTKTVQMDIIIMEVDKTFMRNLGVRWSSSTNPTSNMDFGFGGGEDSFLSPITGVISDLLPKIDHLTSTGKARTLASPTLITKSGEKAELFVGGEIPIPVAQGGGGISIEYKEYGVKLAFEPKVDTQDNIDTTLFVEMSSLGPTTGGGAPGILTNRVNTSIFVSSGQSITLGGLVSSQDARNMDKVPGLGSIPILGNLFKSKQYRRNQTEMLVFATPKVVGVAEAGTELRQKVETDFEEFTEIETLGQENRRKKKEAAQEAEQSEPE